MTGPTEQLSSAIEAAVGGFASVVRNVGWRHRLSDADVDEVMQEVRIRLWRARPTADEVAQVNAAYVYRTASSAALDLLRRRRARGGAVTGGLDEAAAVASAAPTPERELESGSVAEQVARAVDGLAAARRPVVRMYLAGHPREEIAELLGWTEAKVRNLLYRGLADLRERLTAEGITWETGDDD